jgi:ABC-type phosphate transport system auxiliary subunit
MLGAIIKYTVRSKERLRIQRSSTKIDGLSADTVGRIAHIKGEIMKKATAMLRTTHCLHAKKERLALAMRKTTAENGLLQNELDSVQAKLTQMHK